MKKRILTLLTPLVAFMLLAMPIRASSEEIYMKDTLFQPHTVTVILEAKEGKAEALKAVLMKVARLSREEDSNLAYHVHQDTNQPTLFSLYELWKSAELHQEQFSKPYILELLEVSPELLAGPYIGVMGKELLESE